MGISFNRPTISCDGSEDAYNLRGLNLRGLGSFKAHFSSDTSKQDLGSALYHEDIHLHIFLVHIMVTRLSLINKTC